MPDRSPTTDHIKQVAQGVGALAALLGIVLALKGLGVLFSPDCAGRTLRRNALPLVVLDL